MSTNTKCTDVIEPFFDNFIQFGVYLCETMKETELTSEDILNKLIYDDNATRRELVEDFYKTKHITDTRNKGGTLLTEDTGKIFEMALCMCFDTEYVGNFKYSMNEATNIKNKINLETLHKLIPDKIVHTAEKGNQYDFGSPENKNYHLSAKTNKKGGRVCPQKIGQGTKKKYCEYFELDINSTPEQIKNYIEPNVNKLLGEYFKYTFDCDIIYYNRHRNQIYFVKTTQPIDWSLYNISFSHIIKNKQWNESTSISVNNKNIGEFQIHNHRDGIKFRWAFDNLITMFSNHFEVTDLLL